MNNKLREKLIETAGSARTLLANQELIFPMLKQKEEEAIASLIHEFLEKGTASLAQVATIASLRAMRVDFETKAKHGERAMVRLHEMEE